MTPTETLVHEHDVILLVVEAAAREAEAIRAAGRVDADRVARIADFFSGFADACHHAKEEKLLFPRLEERGAIDRGCPIPRLVEEHELGRAHVRAIRAALVGAAAGERAETAAVADHLAEYAAMLREHIRRENEILFPCADRHLTAADQAELSEGFEGVEEETGARVHERYHRLAHELAGRRAGA
jgi:hemerythrin-like domain-containing protein